MPLTFFLRRNGQRNRHLPPPGTPLSDEGRHGSDATVTSRGQWVFYIRRGYQRREQRTSIFTQHGHGSTSERWETRNAIQGEDESFIDQAVTPSSSVAVSGSSPSGGSGTDGSSSATANRAAARANLNPEDNDALINNQFEEVHLLSGRAPSQANLAAGLMCFSQQRRTSSRSHALL